LRNCVLIGQLCCLSCLLLALHAVGAAQKTPQDLDADREFSLSHPQIENIHAALKGEMERLLYERPEPPSAALQRYIYTSKSAPIDIGDTHIPLHIRLIERARQEAIAAIAFAKEAALKCDEAPFNPDQYLDAGARQRVLESVRCHREKLDRYQSGQHRMLKGEEESALALHLPLYSQERELAHQRAHTIQQDAELEADYSERRKDLQTTTDFVSFIDTHAGKIHFTNGRLLFDDPADLKTAQTLISRIKQQKD
jgi:hypothetical protein